MKNDLGKEIVQTFNKLSTERQPYEQIWREAFEFSFPLRGQKFNTSNTDGVSTIHNAQTDKSKLVDSTGKDAARLLAASMLSGLTPSNSQWFNLTIPNSSDEEIDQDAKEWLEDSAHKLFQMIHAANYDSEAYEFFLDMVVGGMCGLYVEHADSGGFSFEFWPLDSLYCKDSLKRRKIDTIFRIINVTPAQAIDMFGNNLPEAIKSEYTNNPDCTKTFQFIHAIRPRMKGNKQSVGKINKTLPWESVYVCKKTGMIVKESGYHEFPVVVPRWLCIPDSDYAVGPFEIGRAHV